MTDGGPHAAKDRNASAPTGGGAALFEAGLEWLADLGGAGRVVPEEVAQLQARVAELEAALAAGTPEQLRQAQEAAERYRRERDALLAQAGQSVVRLPLAVVHPDPAQPRFLPDLEQLRQAADGQDPHAGRMLAELEALGHSMLPPPEGVGQLQPIRVYEERERPGHYVILVGHRRRMAAEAVGLEHIEALVGPAPDAGRLAQQMVENVHRAELAAVERAWGLRRLKEVLEEQAGQEVPWAAVESRCQIGERHRRRLLALLQLPRQAQEIAAQAGLSERALRPVVRISGVLPEKALIELVGRVAQGKKTVDGEVQPLAEAEVETLIRRYLASLRQQESPGDYPPWITTHQQRWRRTALTIAGLARRPDLDTLPAAALAVLQGALDEVEEAARQARTRLEAAMSRHGQEE